MVLPQAEFSSWLEHVLFLSNFFELFPSNLLHFHLQVLRVQMKMKLFSRVLFSVLVNSVETFEILEMEFFGLFSPAVFLLQVCLQIRLMVFPFAKLKILLKTSKTFLQHFCVAPSILVSFDEFFEIRKVKFFAVQIVFLVRTDFLCRFLRRSFQRPLFAPRILDWTLLE